MIIVLLLSAAGLGLAAVIVAIVDFQAYHRIIRAEARAFAHRRRIRPWHLNPGALGDPLRCWNPDHNHDPRDFTIRFRARPDAFARMLAIALLVVAAVLLLLITAGLWLASLVNG